MIETGGTLSSVIGPESQNVQNIALLPELK